jgi:alpha-D-ribose 1-methylphosphonate 5-triphosphate diphosphatase
MSETIISNVRIVTPTDVIEGGTATVKDGRILSLLRKRARHTSGAEEVDGQGRLLLPGFIDLHNDGIEQEIEPRPRAVFPLAVALQSLETQLVGHGITTIFHSFSFMDGREGTLHPEGLEPAIRELNRLRRTGVIRHLVHARYEMVEVHHFDRLCRLIDDRQVSLVSVMDHTPGQGQYRNPEHLVSYYTRKYNTPRGEIDAIIAEREKKAGNPAVDDTLEKLIAHARAAGLRIASHDDDTAEKVSRMHARGVTISEFPVDMRAATAAARWGMHVAVGAPNVLRGQSTTGNLSARDAIAQNAVDILCSDYYSPSILHAVFRLFHDGAMTLPDAVRMATGNPARASGLGGELGSLEVGKRADMILVNDSAGIPSVTAAWVGGQRVYERHDGTLHAMGDRWASEAARPAMEATHVS